MKKKDENLLEMVPVRNPNYPWTKLEDGRIALTIERKGFIPLVAKLLFKKSPFVTIDMDEMSSIVWDLMDGKKTIGEIALELKGIMGEKADPLYPRLTDFIRILNNNNFISIVK